ncbi:MAG: purine-nucleoside phosphorylase, partial [Christensenellales bacterium]
GMRVCGVSCITNMAAGMQDQPLTHTEVMETGEKVKGAFAALVDAFLQQIGRA